MRNISFLVFITLLIFCCNKATETKYATVSVDNTSAISFENEEVLDNANYYIKYPGTWQPVPDGTAKNEFVLSASQNSDGDISSESVHLMKKNLDGKSIAEFIAMTINQYQQEMPDFEIITAANNEFTFLGGSVENKTKYHHRFFEKNGMVYILGFTSRLKNWSTYAETADKVMQTFTLK